MKRTFAEARRGFTLIELLVVIAIICILAAILFPVFAAARSKARQSACMSNMKQIGMALQQYIQDNDTWYPTTSAEYANYSGPGRWASWMPMLFPYTKSTQVFYCPESKDQEINGLPGTASTNPSYASPLMINGQAYPLYSIGANQWLFGDGSGGWYKGLLTTSMVHQPSLTAAYADSTFALFNTANRVYNAGWMPSSATASTNPPIPPSPAYARHNGGCIVGYADGHAKWVPQAAMTWNPTGNLYMGLGSSTTLCGSTPSTSDSALTCWGLPMDPRSDRRLQ